MTSMSIIRGILKELRLLAINSKCKAMFSWRSMPVYAEIRAEFEKMKELQHQQDIKKLKSIGNFYLQYLQALRLEKQLEEMYKGHGERSIKASAAMVGLSLPKTSGE